MVITGSVNRFDFGIFDMEVSGMTIKEIFEKNLKGHDYLKARNLTPQTAMQGEREGRRLSDKLEAVIQLTENWK